jgi:hypothetical protein
LRRSRAARPPRQVSPSSTLAPNAGNDRSWVFTCDDFSNDVLETTKCALRFKDADVAAAFAKAYDAARETNAKLLAAGGGGKPAPAPAPAAAKAAAPAPAPDASGPVPVTDSLASIYGAALENEAIVSLTLAAALRAPFFLRARAHKAPLSHCPPRLAWRRALRSATAP